MSCSIIVLDFETYFDASFSMSHLSIPAYVHDPRFAVHGLAIRHPDGRCVFRSDVEAALHELQAAYGPGFEQVTTVMHNAAFDAYILYHRYGISPSHLLDTMLLSHHVHGRKDGGGGADASLGALAERYHLPGKEDLEFMSGVRHLTVEQAAQLSRYACRDVDITFRLVGLLLPAIDRPQVELKVMQQTIRLFTEGGIPVDRKGILRIYTEVRRDVRTWLTAAAQSIERDLPQEVAALRATNRRLRNAQSNPLAAAAIYINSNVIFAKLMGAALARTGRLVPLKQGKNGMIPALSKTDPAMQELLEDDDPVVVCLAEARIGKKGADSLISKLQVLWRIAQATSGVLPPRLLYFGSHTGRFSSVHFNIQNLGKRGWGLRMRNLLIAGPDHAFVVADLAQIEARIVAWIARVPTLLAAFASGSDVYSVKAAEWFRTEVRKPTDSDAPEFAKRLVALREVGKAAILGLGYNLGALKFLTQLRKEPRLAPLFEDGTLNPRKVVEIVRGFREGFPEIPRMWRKLEAGFRSAYEGGSGWADAIKFTREGDTVFMHLPSGRRIRYARVRRASAVSARDFLDEHGEISTYTPDEPGLIYGAGADGIGIYGGLLMENLVQALARDLLVEAMLRLEARGFTIAFHVHDEVVLRERLDQTAAATAALDEELRRVPAWAPGLPLNCEIHTWDRYQK